MDASDEKGVTAAGAEANACDPGPRSRPSRALPLAAVAAFLGVAALTYLLTRTGAGELPPMPRAAFSPGDERAAAGALAARAAAYEPSAPDRDLEELLAGLGRAEAGEGPAEGRGERVALAMKAFSEAAESKVAADREGYLRHGDRLAQRFGSAVTGLLAAAKRGGLDGARTGDPGRAEEIRDLGGSFLDRAAERGLVGDDGILRGPAFLPEVLFLTRWRALAGLGRTLELTPLERRAHLDFLVAFSTPDAAALRLEAVDALAALEPAYDAVIARALVLHQARRDDEARAVLTAAAAGGRDDAALERFIRFLGL